MCACGGLFVGQEQISRRPPCQVPVVTQTMYIVQMICFWLCNLVAIHVVLTHRFSFGLFGTSSPDPLHRRIGRVSNLCHASRAKTFLVEKTNRKKTRKNKKPVKAFGSRARPPLSVGHRGCWLLDQRHCAQASCILKIMFDRVGQDQRLCLQNLADISIMSALPMLY